MKISQLILSVWLSLFLVEEVTFAQISVKEIDQKGVEFATQGKFKAAKEEFIKALKADSLYSPSQLNLNTINDILKKKINNEAGTHLFKGVQFDNEGKYDQAIIEFNKAIEINPKYADTFNRRGLVYSNLKKYEQAINDYTAAIQLNPKYTDAYNNRGVVYFELDQSDKAISDYTKAIEIDPKYAKAYHNRGLTYVVKLKNNGKGCEDWKKACELGICDNYKIAKEKKICK